MTATPRRSVTAVSRWMLWSHDQTLGETTLIATGIGNGGRRVSINDRQRKPA